MTTIIICISFAVTFAANWLNGSNPLPETAARKGPPLS